MTLSTHPDIPRLLLWGLLWLATMVLSVVGVGYLE